MNTVRLNITLPVDVASLLDKIKNKSAFISSTIKEKFEKEKHNKMVNLLKEGYLATRKEDKQLSDDWNVTIGDGLND